MISNDASPEGTNAPRADAPGTAGAKGRVDIYGHDGYP